MADLIESQSKTGLDKSALAGWIMARVNSWETWRNNQYKTRWDEYYRMYRGVWTSADATRSSERSRIMSPELSQAIETQVAEIEDALFSRERWVDLVDDVQDEQKEDMNAYVNLILDEFEMYGCKAAISEILVNGAVYGTGIGKIVVERIEEPYIDEGYGLPSANKRTKYCVKLIPVSPRNFVIDPNSKNVLEGLGCAHVFGEPLIDVQKKIANGRYRNFPLEPYSDDVEDKNALGELTTQDEYHQMCKIVEWHGLVPKNLIGSDNEELFDDIDNAIKELKGDKDLVEVQSPKDSSAEDMVEAIVVIVNDSHVARAVVNPFIFGDRSFVAYQHETVPDRFWGRGVSEKGYNPQKALDAEIRARIDALGFSTNPMMGIDSTKIPRGETFETRPGKNLLTVGNPAESIMPLKFPPPDPHTFQQTQELREMLQRGTGGYEIPGNIDNSRAAATSLSMIVGAMIKRSRRVLANIERQLLNPFVQKSLWRYMQFRPQDFPMKDYKFKVKTAMGIMAREFEQGQLVSLLSTVPSESPAFWMLMKGIYTYSQIDQREQMMQYCDQMMEQAMNPPPPPPDPELEFKREELGQKWKIHQDDLDVKARELMQQDEMFEAEQKRDEGEGRMQTATAILQMVKAETEQIRAQAESMLNIAKAESERNKQEIEAYKLTLDAMKTETSQALEGGVQKATGEASSQMQSVLDEMLATVDKKLDDMRTSRSLDEQAMEKVLIDFETMQTRAGATDSKTAQAVSDLAERLAALEQGPAEAPMEEVDEEGFSNIQQDVGGSGVSIERDENGRVKSINGRAVKRDGDGLLSGLE